jgi:hypothetical protein
MLAYPLDSQLLERGIAAVVGDDVFAPTRIGPASVCVNGARGQRVPMRRLCSVRTLWEHSDRQNRDELIAECSAALVRGRAEASTDPLCYWHNSLLPAIQIRDGLLDNTALSTATVQSDPAFELANMAASMPLARIPAPSLWVDGRAYVLSKDPSGSLRCTVRTNDEVYFVTNESIAVAQLVQQWQKQVERFAGDKARDFLSRSGPGNDQTHIEVLRRQLEQTGFLQFGDFLFLRGNPPLVGYILPPHYNRSLGRQSNRDLAMTAPLELPPRVRGLVVYELTRGVWARAQLPRSLCLGQPPNNPGDLKDSPGLLLLAHLRWAANRISTNGRFNEFDL